MDSFRKSLDKFGIRKGRPLREAKRVYATGAFVDLLRIIRT